ncbi:DUF423 domain-containing protein [Dokdonella sp.]|uniref:DUF423 domain-containing protein n=1 Tax=Dokdonella sp. TaxID=2291710 RepID=UPI003C39587C
MRDWRVISGTAGSVLAASAVALGAFGAHAMRAQLDAGAMDLWHTAVEYLFWHAFGLILLGLVPAGPVNWRITATLAFLAGIGLFCGSLFAMALGAPRGIGVLTPLGGGAFLLAWASLAVLFVRSPRSG